MPSSHAALLSDIYKKTIQFEHLEFCIRALSWGHVLPVPEASCLNKADFESIINPHLVCAFTKDYVLGVCPWKEKTSLRYFKSSATSVLLALLRMCRIKLICQLHGIICNDYKIQDALMFYSYFKWNYPSIIYQNSYECITFKYIPGSIIFICISHWNTITLKALYKTMSKWMKPAPESWQLYTCLLKKALQLLRTREHSQEWLLLSGVLLQLFKTCMATL